MNGLVRKVVLKTNSRELKSNPLSPSVGGKSNLTKRNHLVTKFDWETLLRGFFFGNFNHKAGGLNKISSNL